MIGLALSGGGVKGSYEVGAYFAFRKCHIKIDGVVGTSIGAINGAMICAGLWKELFHFWYNADIGKVLGYDKEYVENFHLINNFDYYKYKMKNFFKIVQNKGIDVSGIEEVLRCYNLEEKLLKSKMDFGITTYRVKDHKPLFIFFDQMEKGSLNNYILSSCYLPVFKKKKLENDSYYMDGGFVNYMPCNMLLEKGYNHVYCIDLKAAGIYQKILDKNKVTVIKPSAKLSGMLSLDKKLIRNNMRLGFFDTLKVLRNYDGKKYIFHKRSSDYYNTLVEKIPKKDLLFWKSYYHVKTNKELVIKIIEHVMKKENLTYFNVYHINYLIWKYHFSKNNALEYRIIKKLRLSLI